MYTFTVKETFRIIKDTVHQEDKRVRKLIYDRKTQEEISICSHEN